MQNFVLTNGGQVKELKYVEEAFRELKDFVEIRPVFHWKDRRVRTHIFLCILAQTVVNRVRDILKEKGGRGDKKENSFSRFLDIFCELSIGIFDIEDCKVPMINQPTSEHKELLELFDMEERFFSDFTVARRAVG